VSAEVTKTGFGTIPTTGSGVPLDHKATPGVETQLPSGRARVVVLSGVGAGRTCVVDDQLQVGRGPESGLAVMSPEISRHHARIFRTGPREFSIEDQGSRNGTSVNGEQLGSTPRVLVFGDRIQLSTAAVLLFAHFDPAEERLLQAQKLQSLGQLASGVAHDVNNLVGAVLVNVQYLREMKHENPEVGPCLVDSEDALKRVVEMVRRLVDFSRRGRFESTPVALRQLVEQACGMMRHRSSTVDIAVEIPPSLHVLGDSTQLMQVLTNLCANALDAMPGGGRLFIQAQVLEVGLSGTTEAPNLRPGPYARLTVTDTGTGMTPDVLAHLFEPFFTTKPLGKGTGMGLATVHGIVNNHGGNISGRSQPGMGSEFVVYLPQARGMPTPPPLDALEGVVTDVGAATESWKLETEKFSRHPAPAHGEHVLLLVDDEAVVRRSAERLLSRVGGYEVVCASSGDEGIALYRSLQDRVAVVLLDVFMPGRNGLDTCRILKEINPTVRIVLTSGSIEPDQTGGLVGTPGVTFLAKPYDDGQLRTAIALAMMG
jgi:signal transduction histidine kinase/CheY-like chemotaxis protein